MIPDVVINPSRRKTAPPQTTKPVPDWHKLVRPAMSDANPRKSNMEKYLDEDLAELRIVMDLFLNSKMNEAEALLNGRHKPDSMYYHFGKALVDALRAILSFRRTDIEKAMKSFDATLKIANSQRKTSSIVGITTAKAFSSWVVGSIGAGTFKGMTRIEKHAELVYAEAMVLRAGFSVLYHQDFWALIEESVSLRSAFAIFNGLKSHLDTVEHELKAGGDISEYFLDEHIITGLIFSTSLFNIVISFMPDMIIKMLQFVGFPSDRDWGLALLNTAGKWDPRRNTEPESEFEFEDRLASHNNDGMRRQLCDIAPIVIHLVAASFLPFRHVDYSFAEQINNYNLYKYPDSMFFQFLRARHAQVNTRLDESIAIHEAIKVQPDWKNLTHFSVFEQLMCAMMEGNLDLACTKSRQLLRESNWTKTIFRYLTAITTMRRGWPKEAKKVVELMGKVEAGMQTFCGVEIFPETYCARKANRYMNEGHRLLLPDYDFLVLWNGFDMMPLKSLRNALAIIMTKARRLEAHLPPSMVAIADVSLPKGDFTIEATKGILGTFRSGVHSLTKADKVDGYDHFYDDYCIAHYLLGVVAKNIAYFPEEKFDTEMCALAVRSFKTVFRYAPYIKDDTYAYYFSHYNMGMILMNQGHLDQAEEKFKYLLSTINPTLRGLPALIAGKGRNSLEVLILTKAHAAMFLLNEDRANGRTNTQSPMSGNSGFLRSNGSTPHIDIANLDRLTAVFGGTGLGMAPGAGSRATRYSSASSTSSPNRGSSTSSTSASKAGREYRQFPTVDSSYNR